MSTSFFSQFMSPSLMGVPLAVFSILFPCLLLPSPSARWCTSRLTALQAWSLKRFTSQLFTPINIAAHNWALIMAALFIFLILVNLLGLLPYTFTPTTQLSMNLSFAISLWLATLLVGLRRQPMAMVAHLLPEGTPTPLIPALITIETTSLFIRPLALGVRLTANLTAGHLLMQLFGTAAFVVSSAMPAVAALTLAVLFFLTILEIAVAMIQAYVFVLLLSLYLQESV